MTNKQRLNNAIMDLREFKNSKHEMSKHEKEVKLKHILSEIKAVVHDKKVFEQYQTIIKQTYVFVTT